MKAYRSKLPRRLRTLRVMILNQRRRESWSFLLTLLLSSSFSWFQRCKATCTTQPCLHPRRIVPHLSFCLVGAKMVLATSSMTTERPTIGWSKTLQRLPRSCRGGTMDTKLRACQIEPLLSITTPGTTLTLRQWVEPCRVLKRKLTRLLAILMLIMCSLFSAECLITQEMIYPNSYGWLGLRQACSRKLRKTTITIGDTIG